MSEHLSNAIKWCASNKKLFVFSFLCFLVFGFLIFPYDDLTGFVADQVYTNSNKRVTLSASGLSLSAYPLGVEFSGDDETPLTIDSLDFPPTMPPLELDSMAISPSILKLLQAKSGFFAQLQGLFGGNANVKFSQGKDISPENSKNKVYEIELDLSADDIGLDPMGRFFALPMKLKGQAEIDMDAKLDPGFFAQPNSQFELRIKKLRLVGFNYIGMAVPTLDFKSARIKGSLTEGDLNLDEVQLGEKGDDLFGVIKGQVRLRLQRLGQNIRPQIGTYRLNLDLTAANKFAPTLDLLDAFLPDIKRFKTKAPGASRFNVALSGPGPGVIPKLSRPRR